MRNCFVPHCDAYCKLQKIKKRMMFIPPRDEKIFNAWRKLLFNKRPFRRKDKVCERHFTKDEIVTHWKYMIGGNVVSLERDKPKLKPTAIPTMNLPEMPIPSDEPSDYSPSNDVDDMTTQTMQKKNTAKRAGHNSNVEQKPKRINVVHVESENVSENLIDEFEDDSEIIDDNQQPNAVFESIFDDIYEVVLPTTLWGVHRDPNRKFIAFSEFDASNMTTSKLLHITDTLEMKAYFYNTEVQLPQRHHLSLDVLTDSLTGLDEYRACESFRADSNQSYCEIVAMSSGYCRNCIKTAST